MIGTLAVVLHAGAEVTLPEYLVRFVAYLLAFGAVALFVFLGFAALEAVRSALETEHG